MSNIEEQKTVVENIESVDFGDLRITTKLNTGYEGGVPEEYQREVILHFVGIDEASDDIQRKLIEELAGKFRIKVNQPAPSGVLKGDPSVKDAQSYVKFLDSHDCEFTFNVGELYAPSSRKLTEQEASIRAIRKMEAKGQIEPAKADEMVAIIQATEE